MLDTAFAVIKDEYQRSKLTEFYSKSKNRLFGIAYSKLHSKAPQKKRPRNAGLIFRSMINRHRSKRRARAAARDGQAIPFILTICTLPRGTQSICPHLTRSGKSSRLRGSTLTTALPLTRSPMSRWPGSVNAMISLILAIAV